MHNELLLCRELSLQDLQGREQFSAATILWPGFTSSLCSHVKRDVQGNSLVWLLVMEKGFPGKAQHVPLPSVILRLIQGPSSHPCLMQCIQTPLPTPPTGKKEHQSTRVFGCYKFRGTRKLSGPSMNSRAAHCSLGAVSHHFPMRAPLSARSKPRSVSKVSWSGTQSECTWSTLPQVIFHLCSRLTNCRKSDYPFKKQI